jgi:hypothetical protein
VPVAREVFVACSRSLIGYAEHGKDRSEQPNQGTAVVICAVGLKLSKLNLRALAARASLPLHGFSIAAPRAHLDP